MRNIFIIVKKELTRFFSDKRLVLSSLILPGLLIYIMYSLMGSFIFDSFVPSETEVTSIHVVNMPTELEEVFGSIKTIEIIEATEDQVESLTEQVQDSEINGIVIFPDKFFKKIEEYLKDKNENGDLDQPKIEIISNSSNIDGQHAISTFEIVLNEYEQSLVGIFEVKVNDLATDEQFSSMMMSMMMPMLMLVFIFSGCLGVAPESIAGEKERGTMATMLVTPTKRSHIAMGKIISLSLISLASGVTTFIGTMLSLPNLMGGNSNMLVNIYSFGNIMLLLFVILSTVLLIVSMISVISAYAKTVKEATTLCMPLMMLVMVVGLTSMVGGNLGTKTLLYIIPLYNSVLAIGGIFSFDINVVGIIIGSISNLAFASLLGYLLTRMFNSEKIMFNK